MPRGKTIDLDTLTPEERERVLKARERNRVYREANKEKVVARVRAWKESNKEKVLSRTRAWRQANKEKVLAGQRAHYEANKEKVLTRKRANCEALRDCYVKSVIAEGTPGLSFKDIPPEMVELTRLSLQIHRAIKGKKHELQLSDH